MAVDERHPWVSLERPVDLGECVGSENVVVVEFHKQRSPRLGASAMLGCADPCNGVIDEDP